MMNYLGRWLTPAAVCGLLAACSLDEGNAPTQQTVQRISCATTGDCAGRGGNCVAGQCTADNECVTDLDCVAPLLCLPDPDFGGLCAAADSSPTPLPAWSCQLNSDCPKSQTCSAGTCAPAPAPSPAPQPPSAKAEICDNRLDDDGDGQVDCADADCVKANLCRCQGPQGCPCDLLQQNCPASELCWPNGKLAAEGQCYPVGPVSLGQACAEPPLGGKDACAKGLICVGTAEDAAGSCAALCGASLPCPPDHTCKTLDLGDGNSLDFGACLKNPPPPPPPPCDLFKQSCPAGQMCVARAQGANECLPAGKGKAGAVCLAEGDCAPGLQCAALAGMTPPSTMYFSLDASRGGNCLPVCLPGGSPGCSSGSCSPVLQFGNTRTDVGICY